jgi:ligand-binding sensor domain-containing protein
VIDLPQAVSVPGRLLKAALLLSFLTAALAQGVVVDHWTNENGLPVNSVCGIWQGPEGYLWLATDDGLVRFDGVRFAPFNKSNSDGILSDRFFWLVCGRYGGFWAPTEGQGLTHHSKRAFPNLHGARRSGLQWCFRTYG